MVAKGKVSLIWQIVFSFLPIVTIWSFYRIKKLRWFLIMAVPTHVIIYLLLLSAVGSENFTDCWLGPLSMTQNEACENITWALPAGIVNFVYYGIRTIFIIKWTKEWNKAYTKDA